MSTPDHIRIGDAERDSVATALHDHFAKGRLDRSELDERLDATLAAKTHADLREIVRDLPGPSGLPQPAQPNKGTPQWAHHHGMRHRHHHHGPPPFVPLLFLIFLIATIASGPATGLIIAIKAMFLFWLAAGIFAFIRLRRMLRSNGLPR